MNKRYLRRKYRHRPQRIRSRRLSSAPPPCPNDPAAFDQLVRQRIEKLFGGPLEVVAPDPDLREVVYSAVATALRRPVRPIPPDSLEFAARMRKHGLIITPGTSDFSDLPEPLDLGWSLSEAIIEYRRRGL